MVSGGNEQACEVDGGRSNYKFKSVDPFSVGIPLSSVMNTRIHSLLGAALSLLVTIGFSALAAISVGAAPGGGGGGTGGGTIYYIGPWPNATSGGNAIMTKINSDGSNKTYLGLGLFGPPSREVHNGHRWFVATLGISGESYPDGSPRRELFAFRDDYDVNSNNTPETRVRLTDDSALVPSSADWLPADQEISFIGLRWSSADPRGVAIEAGLYIASLVFDGSGNIIGLESQPATPVISTAIVEIQPGVLRADLAAYSWDSAGERVTYTKNDSTLWVANLLNMHTQIFAGAAHAPQWSPDGSKIAFTGGGIWTIKPNGAALKLVVRQTSAWFPSHVFWSPTGTHFAFAGESNIDLGNSDVFRVPATGGTAVNLTPTPAPFRESLHESQGGWR